jgi:hypothetical protein
MAFTNRDRIALYTHLRGFEGDFDRSQAQIRTVTSAWTAAVLGAIGYLTVNLASRSSAAGVDSGNAPAEFLIYLREVICFIGSLGIYAFWYVDQRIYQRLLHSVYAYGLYLEYLNPELPQVRSAVYRANLDITYGLSVFYRVQFWALTLLSWILLFVNTGDVPAGPICYAFALAVVFTIVIGLLDCRARKWRSLDEIVRLLFPDLADRLPKPGEASDAAWLSRVRANPMMPVEPE